MTVQISSVCCFVLCVVLWVAWVNLWWPLLSHDLLSSAICYSQSNYAFYKWWLSECPCLCVNVSSFLSSSLRCCYCWCRCFFCSLQHRDQFCFGKLLRLFPIVDVIFVFFPSLPLLLFIVVLMICFANIPSGISDSPSRSFSFLIFDSWMGLCVVSCVLRNIFHFDRIHSLLNPI